MSLSLSDRYRRWYTYEKDVHEKTRQSLDTVPPDRRGDGEFQRAVDLFAHLMAARKLWLYRFGVIPDGPKAIDELFPKGVALDALQTLEAETQSLWSRYLDSVDDQELERVFEYRAVEGSGFRNRVEDILTQLFGHSWYHRGQIASVVRALGGTPAVTDFVFWAREPIE